jgi:UDP-N-acetylenolpyruvoylglucosamine reductase
MAELRGPITAGEPMAGTCRGAPAAPVARAFFPADLDDLANFLGAVRHDEPLLLVGLGSNLLVRDGGFDGTAVFTHGALGTCAAKRTAASLPRPASLRPSWPASPANRAVPRPGS